MYNKHLSSLPNIPETSELQTNGRGKQQYCGMKLLQEDNGAVDRKKEKSV